MSDWTDGYVADIGYTYGYYGELNPARVAIPFLSAGLAVPSFGTACELGFGQGMSVNAHAAATSVQWCGTDFNPSQAAFAQELAQVSGSGAHLVDQAFAEFCARTDLPDFDFIGLHGIWTWISDENRAVIVDFVRRKLKVGGVLYVSYNTLPGWASGAPLRHLMAEHAHVMGAPGEGIVKRINGSLAFTEKLLALNTGYLRAVPSAMERFNKLKDQNRNYLAHEYFNRDWHPMYFAKMAQWLASAKVTYACSAHYLDSIDAINLTPEQQELLREIPDPIFRQTVRDYCVNQQFRRDYWVKGARQITPLQQAEEWRKQRVLMVVPRKEIVFKVIGNVGEAVMKEDVYGPILDVLSDHKIHEVGQLEARVADKQLPLAQFLQALVMLCGKGDLVPVQDDKSQVKARPKTDRLNLHIMQLARASDNVPYLASPVSGGGVQVPRFQQLFMLARLQGHKQPAEWAAFAWQILASQAQRILKEGKPLETAEDNLAALTAQANEFQATRLPIMRALGLMA